MSEWKLQKPFLTWTSLTLQLPSFFNSNLCVCVIQTSLYCPYSIYIIYNREGNFYKINSPIVSVSDGSLPLKWHRIYCIQLYSQSPNINVLLHAGLSCTCTVIFLLPNATGSSWGVSSNNVHVLQLPAGAALLTSLMRANVLMVGKTFLTQGHALEKKDMAFLPGTRTSSGLPWQWPTLCVCSKKLPLNPHTVSSPSQHG